jgi:hypothetical protein
VCPKFMDRNRCHFAGDRETSSAANIGKNALQQSA